MTYHNSGRARRGFTLIELLVALVLFSIVGALFTKLMTVQGRFFDRQGMGNAARNVSRASLNRIVSEFDAEVQRQNLTPAEGLKWLEDNSDPLARECGEDLGKTMARAERLNDQIQAMNSAGPLMRLYVVATRFDPDVASSALNNYEPAVPLSVGALTAGGLAALWGWAATRLIAWPFSRRSRLRVARA